jgi:hypothetical protein
MGLSAKKFLHNLPVTPLGPLGPNEGDIEKVLTGQHKVTTWRPVLSAAGFKGHALDTAVAIVKAESGGDAKVQNSIGATGGLQILLSAHPDVTKECAQNPMCAAKVAYRLSDGGKDWGPWAASRGTWSKNIRKGADLPIKNGTAEIKGGLADAGKALGGLNPLNSVNDAISAIGAVADIIENPTKLGELVADAFAWWIKLVAKSIYKWVILPPWHWSERAVTYYYEVQMDDGTKALITLAFWATGYAVLFAKVEDEPSFSAKPNQTPLGRSLGTFRNLSKRPKLHSPKNVEKATPVKPNPVVSAVPIGTMRELSASRRRAITVRENGRERNRENGNETLTEATEQSAEDALGIAPQAPQHSETGVAPQRPSRDSSGRAVEENGRGNGRSTGRRFTPRTRGTGR